MCVCVCTGTLAPVTDPTSCLQPIGGQPTDEGGAFVSTNLVELAQLSCPASQKLGQYLLCQSQLPCMIATNQGTKRPQPRRHSTREQLLLWQTSNKQPPTAACAPQSFCGIARGCLSTRNALSCCIHTNPCGCKNLRHSFHSNVHPSQ